MTCSTGDADIHFPFLAAALGSPVIDWLTLVSVLEENNSIKARVSGLRGRPERGATLDTAIEKALTISVRLPPPPLLALRAGLNLCGLTWTELTWPDLSLTDEG